MGNRVQPVYQVGGATGTTVTSGAASANVAIPNDSNGTTARAVMLTAGGVANPALHVKLGTTNAVAATANDLMVGPLPIVVVTRGYGWIAYLQETAATKLQIAPIEDV